MIHYHNKNISEVSQSKFLWLTISTCGVMMPAVGDVNGYLMTVYVN